MGALGDAIRVMNAMEVKEAIANFADSYDEQVINAGNENAEIVRSRGKYPSLWQRLDNMKVATPKGTYTTLAELQTAHPTYDGNIYLVGDGTGPGYIYDWNGTTWVDTGIQYLSTGIAKGSIAQDKIYDAIINILNPDTVSIGQNLTSSGTLTANANYSTTDFIPVKNGDTINLSKATDKYAVYDSNQNFIQYYASGWTLSFTIAKANAAFVKWSYGTDSSAVAVINNSVPVDYIPYGKAIINWLALDNLNNSKIHVLNGSIGINQILIDTVAKTITLKNNTTFIVGDLNFSYTGSDKVMPYTPNADLTQFMNIYFNIEDQSLVLINYSTSLQKNRHYLYLGSIFKSSGSTYYSTFTFSEINKKNIIIDGLSFNDIEKIQNGNINQDKIAGVSTNILNVTTNTDGKKLSYSGGVASLVDNASYTTTDYILVKPGDVINLNRGTDTYIIYDSNQNPITSYISGSFIQSVTIGKSSAAFIRFSYGNDSTPTMIIKNNPVPSSYVGYNQSAISWFPSSNINVTQDNIAGISTNILNVSTNTIGKILSYSGGVASLVDNTSYQTTDYIPVKNGDVINVSRGFNTYIIYDSNQNPISSYISGSFILTTTINKSKAAFIRLSYGNDSTSTMVIKNNQVPTSYIAYNKSIINWLAVLNMPTAIIVADDLANIDCDAGTIAWHGDMVINGKYYTITNKNMTFTIASGIQHIFYNKSTSTIVIYNDGDTFSTDNLYYIGSFKSTTGYTNLSFPYRIKKNNIWRTNCTPENSNQVITYPTAYGMPKYEPTTNYVPNIPASLSNFYFSGRWFPHNENSVDYMGVIQQGHEIYAKVTGTAQITATVLDKSPSTYPAILAVKIDDSAWTRYTIAPGTTSIQIATGLDTNEHWVRIMVSMKTDGRFDDNEAFYFGGFTLDAGGSILPIKPRNRVCFGIGDSITAGKNILGLYQSAAEMGYISIMGDNLNTRISRDAHAGTGLINPAGSTYCLDYVNSIKNNLVDNYDHRPDFITINHGTNDNTYAGVTSDSFKTAYNALINRLRHKFPGVPIFCIVPFGQYFAAEIADVVSQNSTVCILVPTAGWGITYTDGVHPNVAGSITAGNKLSDFLLSYFGRDYFIVA